LPRVIGRDPETGGEITAGIGRFGPYIRLGSAYQSLEPGDDVLTLGMNRAMDLLAKARAKVRPLGFHPQDGQPVEIRKGRFGPYAQHGNRVANLPRGVEMEEVTLDQGVQLLAEKGKELAPKGAKTRRSKAAAGKSGAASKANGEADAEPATASAARKPPAGKVAARKASAAKPARDAAAPAAKPAAKPPTARAAKPSTARTTTVARKPATAAKAARGKGKG
jgi:DNA topoisomerase-1